MAAYQFFVKDGQVLTLNSATPDFAGRQESLLVEGYEKQFEALDAASPEAALMRFKDIKEEEAKAEHAFSTGSVFSSLINAVLK